MGKKQGWGSERCKIQNLEFFEGLQKQSSTLYEGKQGVRRQKKGLMGKKRCDHVGDV